jgi:hypothetical protein
MNFKVLKIPMNHTTIINTAYERSNAKANNEHKSVITSRYLKSSLTEDEQNTPVKIMGCP